MTGQELVDLLKRSCRRLNIIGDLQNGVVAALNMEGRLFTIVNGKVLNRVVPSAIMKRSNRNSYQNPGGDALWPAPEGSALGYEYSTGNWRVPPAITNAEWEVIAQNVDSAVIRAEIDLINNQQLGIPCEFERRIKIETKTNCLINYITETIRYIGKKNISKGTFLLAPWSLCQFDSGEQGKVLMNIPGKEDLWDIYASSEAQRKTEGDLYMVQTKTPERFQLALSENMPWIEYVSGNEFRVKRYVSGISAGQHYIDITDAPPEQKPSSKGVKLSVYCDPTGFMEIEACGGCSEELKQGTELSVNVVTEYRIGG